MAKGPTKAAKSLQQQTAQNAQGIEGTLAPQLTQQMKNPQGMSPADLAAANTASQQSLGGSVAGAVGEGNLEAARTGNAGGFAPALDEAARGAGRELSQNALGVQERNALLKNEQQQDAERGLGSLYGQNLQGSLGALNQWGQQANQGFGSNFMRSFGSALGNTLGNFGFSRGGLSMGSAGPK